MSENGEPRWELLPHDPAGFFELAESFDRKALKQRYSALIRRYKPEKHPSEFQRIRAAFEALDASLRYGQQGPLEHTAFRYQWSTDPLATNVPEGGTSGGPARGSREQPVQDVPQQARSIASRLEHEEPRQLYEELEQRESKSAYDYYALAVLADLVKPNERLGFLRWILEGLKALPQEPALSALLYEMLRQNDFGDANVKVLLVVSQVFPSDRFYYFTESVWARLLKRDSAEHFATSLERCEANLRDHRIGAKVTFYVRLLRTALWRASDPWIDRTLAFLKEHEDQISGELEYEMEFNLQLDRYRRSAQLFVDGSPQREKIDRCIREFCTLDEQQAAERLVRSQLELAADSQALLSAVPFDETDLSAAYHALRSIAQETNAKLGIDSAPPNYDELWENTVRFMREIDAQDDPNPWQLNGVLKIVVDIAAIGVLATVAVFLLMSSLFVIEAIIPLDRATSDAIFILTPILGAIFVVIFYIAVLREKTTNRWFDRLRRRIAVRKYQRHWRYQTLRFAQNTQYPLNDVHDAITAAVQNNPGVFQASTWLPGFIARDFGLAFYVLARSYVR